MDRIKAALQNNDLASAAQLAKEYLEKLDNVELTIGVTGESGSGKSTLVNALRGLKNSDEGAAKTGVVETTMEPTEYHHPDHPNVKIWDLPGIGTPTFKAAQYLKEVGLSKFDFFLIMSNTRFKENDAKLAQEIQKMRKKFYFVRTKIDHDIQDEKRCKKDFNEKETLSQIRENCIQGLEQLGIKSPKVFLVSNFDLHLYDFGALTDGLIPHLASSLCYMRRTNCTPVVQRWCSATPPSSRSISTPRNQRGKRRRNSYFSLKWGLVGTYKLMVSAHTPLEL